MWRRCYTPEADGNPNYLMMHTKKFFADLDLVWLLIQENYILPAWAQQSLEASANATHSIAER